MFKVYGLKKREDRKRKWLEKNPQELTEQRADYQDRLTKYLASEKPLSLNEFDVLECAQKYIELCRKEGFKQLEIRIEKLIWTGNKGRPISRTLIPFSEMQNLDVNEQRSLRAQI